MAAAVSEPALLKTGGLQQEVWQGRATRRAAHALCDVPRWPAAGMRNAHARIHVLTVSECSRLQLRLQGVESQLLLKACEELLTHSTWRGSVLFY